MLKIDQIKNTPGFQKVHIDILEELKMIANFAEPTKTIK